MAEPLLNEVSIVSMGVTAVMAIIAWVLTSVTAKKCSYWDKLIVFWLIWDAMIHFCVEGLFIYLSLTGTVQDSTHWSSLLWKEYGKADYRWLVSDPNIVSLEILTVLFDGPLCIILVCAICGKKYYRHWIQLVLCTCELYGGWMTFAPDWLQGSPNLNTSNWLYLWVYLVFFNGLWVIIPLLMMLQSWSAMKEAFGEELKPNLPSTPSKEKKKSRQFQGKGKKGN